MKNHFNDEEMSRRLAAYRETYQKSPFAPCTSDSRAFPVSDYLDFKRMLSEDAQQDHKSEQCLNSPFNLKRLLIEKEHSKVCYSEALIETYPTKMIVRSFREWYKKNVDDQLQHMRLSDIVQQHYATRDIDQWLDYELADIAEIQQYADDNNEDGSDIVTFYIPYFKSKIDETSSMLDDLCNALYRCGYNIASSEKIVFDQKYQKRSDIGVIYVTFEPKFSRQNFDFSEFLYHVTPTDTLHKINARGLMPLSKHSFFKYPDRVYLFSNCPVSSILDYGISKAQRKNQTKVALLRIKSLDLTCDVKYKNGINKFYVDKKYQVLDGNEPIAIYTYNNIDRKLIDDNIVVFEIYNGIVQNKKDDLLVNY